MRAITEQASHNLILGNNWKKSNTEVINHENLNIGDVTIMKLHNNSILYYSHHTKEVIIDFCGWYTPTTKERINGFLSIYGSKVRFSTKNKIPTMTTKDGLLLSIHKKIKLKIDLKTDKVKIL